jgi:hypothetical protein
MVLPFVDLIAMVAARMRFRVADLEGFRRAPGHDVALRLPLPF